MKSLCLLTKALIILSCSFSVIAQEEFDEIYSQAKVAFNDNDCKSTISLLTTYLTLAKPNQAKLDSIYSAIGWCNVYLQKGRTYRKIRGVTASKSNSLIYKETAFGAEMKKHKGDIP